MANPFRVNTQATDLAAGITYTGDIGFEAHAVIVDNYTGYWLYFPDGDAYVAPYYIGVVIPLAHSTTHAAFILKSPFTGTAPQSPTGVSYFVHHVWVDAPLGANAGSLVNIGGGGPTPPQPVIVTNQCCDVDYAIMKATGTATGQTLTDPGGGVVAELGASCYDTIVDPTGAYGSGGNGLANGKFRTPQNGSYRIHWTVNFSPDQEHELRIGTTLKINAVVHNPDYDVLLNQTALAVAQPSEDIVAYWIVPGLLAGDLISIRANATGNTGENFVVTVTEFGMEFIGS